MGATEQTVHSKGRVKRALAEVPGPRQQERPQPDVAINSGLGRASDPGGARPIGHWQSFKQVTCAPSSRSQKILCTLFWAAVFVVAAVLFAVIFPRFVDRVVSPFIQILRKQLTPLQTGFVIFAAMVILPFTLVITVIPFVWVAGIIFNFPLALAIVMAGSTVGMALQYLLARYAFHDRVERFVNNSPKRHGLAVTLRAVELAGPWKMVALLRLGPFPYHLLNYALGICPSIKFHVAMICSVICEILPRSLQVFFGKSLETLADLFRGKVHNVGIAVYNILVLLFGIFFVILSVIVSRRLLKRIEQEELQREAAAVTLVDPEAGLDQAHQAIEAAAAAATDHNKTLDLDSKQIHSKLHSGSPAAAPAAAGAANTRNLGRGLSDNLQILADVSSSDTSTAAAAAAAAVSVGASGRANSCNSSASSSSMIPVGQMSAGSAASIVSYSSSGLSKVDTGFTRMDSQLSASTSTLSVSIADSRY